MKMIKENFINFPIYILFRPFDGFYELKFRKKGRLEVALLFLFLSAILSIIEYQYTGYLINQNDPQSLNSILELSKFIVPILIIVTANWSITTLLDGKGKYKDIFMMICYSLLPMIFTRVIAVIYSNVMISEEIAFYTILLSIGTLWTAFLVFVGTITIHEYSLNRAVITVLLTIVSTAVIIFLMLLFFSMIQQLYGFVASLLSEIKYRTGW